MVDELIKIAVDEAQVQWDKNLPELRRSISEAKTRAGEMPTPHQRDAFIASLKMAYDVGVHVGLVIGMTSALTNLKKAAEVQAALNKLTVNKPANC